MLHSPQLFLPTFKYHAKSQCVKCEPFVSAFEKLRGFEQGLDVQKSLEDPHAETSTWKSPCNYFCVFFVRRRTGPLWGISFLAMALFLELHFLNVFVVHIIYT